MPSLPSRAHGRNCSECFSLCALRGQKATFVDAIVAIEAELLLWPVRCSSCTHSIYLIDFVRPVLIWRSIVAMREPSAAFVHTLYSWNLSSKATTREFQWNYSIVQAQLCWWMRCREKRFFLSLNCLFLRCDEIEINCKVKLCARKRRNILCSCASKI